MDLLPNEVIIEIFSFLGCYELRELMLTCKKFYRIVSETAVLMDKFYLDLKSLNNEEQLQRNGNRKYRDLTVSDLRQNLDEYSGVNNLWENIVNLVIDSYDGLIDWTNF